MTRTLVVTPLLLLAACGTASTDNAAVSANASADLTPEAPSFASKLLGGGKALPLDVQQQGANGTIIYLTSIQAKPTETVVGIKVVNGFERDVELNWSDQKTFLTAAGQKFFLSPPLENKDVKVGCGATMQGEFVFLGRLPKDAPVALVINDTMSNSQYSSNPNFSIPIPATSAAFSDDGSKKN